jgi:hypothetical protein
MKSRTIAVEDSLENQQICMKYCGACPSYRKNNLGQHQPDSLFCARGISNAPQMKEDRCFCPACELFTGYSLVIGHFCHRS